MFVISFLVQNFNNKKKIESELAVCTYEEFIFSDSSSTVQQIDSDRTQIIKNMYKYKKLDNMQNSTNTIYKIDNLICTGMLGANLKCNKYAC